MRRPGSQFPLRGFVLGAICSSSRLNSSAIPSTSWRPVRGAGGRRRTPTASMARSHADAAGEFREWRAGMLLVEVDDLGALAAAPCRAASARRSTAKTRPAPISQALAMANCPTGPQPNTATVSPGLISAMSAPK